MVIHTKFLKIAAAVAVSWGLLTVVRVVTRSDTICLFKNITGLPCPGCGMTHAFFDFIRLDFKAAYYHNAFSVLFYSVFFLMIFAELLFKISKNKYLISWIQKNKKTIIILAAIISGINWSINLYRHFSQL